VSNPNVSDWDKYLEQTEERAKESGGGDFIKLGAGEMIDIVFVTAGFPYHDEKFDKNRELFVVYDVKAKANKVLDISTFFVGGWAATLREYGPLYRYKLKRDGTEKNTRYTLMPAKDGALTEEQIMKIRALPQPDIIAIASKKEGVRDRDIPPADESGEDSGSIPFALLATLGAGALATWLAVSPVLSAVG
jgi:hypothetical protein